VMSTYARSGPAGLDIVSLTDPLNAPAPEAAPRARS